MRIRGKWRFGATVALVAAVALVTFLWAGVALGNVPDGQAYNYDTATDCRHCHDVAGAHPANPEWEPETLSATLIKDFRAGTASTSTALAGCNNCHLARFAGGKHPHNTGIACNGCHSGYQQALPSAVAWYYDSNTDAAFNSSRSTSTDPQMLHTIHAQPRWAAGKDRGNSRCASCHAPAKCDACHVGAVPHGSHAAGTIGTWTGTWTAGYTGATADTSTLVATTPGVEEVYCGTAACHDMAGWQSWAVPSMQDNDPHSAYDPLKYANNAPTYTPAITGWSRIFGSVYSLDEARIANKNTHSVTFTWDGSRVQLISDKDPYRGMVDIFIDGNPVPVVDNLDLYSAITVQQKVVFDTADYAATRGLANTSGHTIKIQVTGEKNAAARDSFVLVDQIKVYTNGVKSNSPFCGKAGCHPTAVGTPATPHPDGGYVASFDHLANSSVYTPPANGGATTYQCSDCHNMLLYDYQNTGAANDHDRASASYLQVLGANTCGSATTGCHPNISSSSDNNWSTSGYARTCSWTNNATNKGCHVAPTGPITEYGEVMHHSLAASHTVDATRDPNNCRDCHTGALDAIHNNSITTNVATPNCKSCHTPTSMPPSNWTCSTCHSGYTMDNHTYNGATHQATFSPSVEPSSSVSCSACHNARMSEEHTSTLAPVGNVTCVECHTNTSGALNNPRNVIATNWPNNYCSDCHTTRHDEIVGTNVGHNYAAKGGTCYGCHGPGGSNTQFTSWDLAMGRSSGSAGYFHNGRANEDGGAARTSCNLCHIDADQGRIGTETARVTAADNLKNVASCNTCHDYAGISYHAGANFDHLATASSDYVSGTQTGCTNAGAGCHGTSRDLKSTGIHTKAIGCSVGSKPGALGTCHNKSSGVEYSSVDRPADNNECSECHGAVATYRGDTSDRWTLTQAWTSDNTGGHYGETTHTAASSGIDAGGSATATCDNCHAPGTAGVNRGLAAQHVSLDYKTANNVDGTVNCVECHNYTQAAEIPTLVKSTWSPKNCQACHTLTVLGEVDADLVQHATVPVVNGTSDESCGNTSTNCHNSYDLHYLHRGDGVAPEPSCSGGAGARMCHDYSAQGKRPLNTTPLTERKCETCHVGYSANGHYDTAKHSSTDQAAQLYSGNACSTCHAVTGANMDLKQSHEMTYAVLTQYGNLPAKQGCLNCHNNTNVDTVISNSWPTPRRCADCHDGTGIASAHGSQTASHTTGVASANCGATGTGCHNTADLGAVGTDKRANNHNSCLRCHDRTAASGTWISAGAAVNLQYNPSTKTCGNTGGTCHNVGYPNGAGVDQVHANRGTPITGNEALRHAATGDAAATYQTLACTTCHSGISNNLSLEHTRTSSTVSGSGTVCVKCHTAQVAMVKGTDGAGAGDWTASGKNCADCHLPASTHNASSTAHAATGYTTTGCTANGTEPGCHNSVDNAAVHNGAAGCISCHGTAKLVTGTSCGAAGDTNCHPNYRTAASSHTSATASTDGTHTASLASISESVTISGLTLTGKGRACSNCHSQSLGDAAPNNTGAHRSTATSAAFGCKTCHNQTSPISASAQIWPKGTTWNKRCDACHSTAATMHNTVTTAHNGAATGANTCIGGSCHGSDRNLARLHDGAASSNSSNPGCTAVGTGAMGVPAGVGCHTGSTKDSRPATGMTCGTGGTCHNTALYIDGGHGADHNANVTGGVYTNAGNTGCFGCHFTDLRQEHGDQTLETASNLAGASRAMTTAANAAYPASSTTDDRCNACHDDKLQTDGSTLQTAGRYNETNNTRVNDIVDKTGVYTTYGKRCDGCHFTSNGTGGPRAPHTVTGKAVTVYYDGTGGATYASSITSLGAEFVDNATGTTWTGGHSSYKLTGGAFPNTVAANTTIGGYTLDTAWSWKGAGNLTNGYTATSYVPCSGCHAYSSARYPNGPLGSSVPVSIDPSYTASWRAATESNMTNSTLICRKCHTASHATGSLPSGHSGVNCVGCHVAIPHAWKRPRLLLNRTADAPPYEDTASLSNGLMGFHPMGQTSKGAGTVASWEKTDCNSAGGCGQSGHDLPTANHWP